MGDKVSRPTATLNPFISGISSIGTGGQLFSMVVTNAGLAYSTGTGGYLGQGDSVARQSFTLIPNLSNVLAVSAGFGHSLLLLQNGSVAVTGEGSVIVLALNFSMENLD